MHGDQIYGVRAPAKAKRDELDQWVKELLVPLVEGLEQEPTCALLFTDGSQKRTGDAPTDVAAGAAWAVVHAGKDRRGRFGIGKATPYDAEMAALARGLKEVLRDLPESVTDVHVFADNQAAVASRAALAAHCLAKKKVCGPTGGPKSGGTSKRRLPPTRMVFSPASKPACAE